LFFTVFGTSTPARVPVLLRNLGRGEWREEEQRRAEGAAAALARKMRPKTQKEIDQMRALWSAAKALAVSQGRKEASFADLRECRGVPRLVSSKRKD
jgi:hypothetical protein